MRHHRAALLCAAISLAPVTAAAPALATPAAPAAPAALAAPATPVATAAGAGAAAPVGPKPVSLVVLVDESGSLGEADVVAERDGAALIGQSEVATGSQVTVIGFGGRNGRPGQSPVSVVCRPTTVAQPTDQEYLATCVKGVHRRTKQEGDSTDFPSAVSQALSVLKGQSADRTKVVFLLTDGKLDVSADKSYGDRASAAVRNAAALAALHRGLAAARQADVQVWPLGFGRGPDLGQLADIASRGSQRTCGHGSPLPRARLARDAAAVHASLVEAFTAARCLGTTRPDGAQLGSGSTVELSVTVPPIATDGSIAVYKKDARVTVRYYDPAGTLVPKSGPQGSSTFQVSGEGSAVEVLRVGDPQPGRWKVVLDSAPGVPAQNVSAQVIWQGAVRSSVTLDPPTLHPGDKAVVQVTLATGPGVLTDPAALREVTVSSQLTGAGFGPQNVPLADDGQGADNQANDGVFSGELTMPTTATGAFRVIGFVAGPGISADEVPADGTVAAAGGKPDVVALIHLDPHRVAPGDVLTGTIEAANPSGASRRLRLVLAGPDQGTLATVTPATVQLPDSGQATFDFQVHLDPRSQLGPASLRLRVLDDADPAGAGYADRLFTFLVAYPPPWWRRWLWALVSLAGALVAAGAGLAVQLRRRRAARDVGGLVVEVSRDGAQQNTWAVAGGSPRFRFVLRDDEQGRPRFDQPAPGDRAYVAQRDGSSVLVRLPHGGELLLVTGQLEELPNGLQLSFRDARPSSGRGRGSRSAGRKRAAGPAAGQHAPYAPYAPYDAYLGPAAESVPAGPGHRTGGPSRNGSGPAEPEPPAYQRYEPPAADFDDPLM
jgi:hypothetical protein